MRWFGWYSIGVLIILSFSHSAIAKEHSAEVEASGGSFVLRVAPGETLPVSLKLLNFGGSRRIDVSVTYEIFDRNEVRVLREVETVAVETTASFVKKLPIPVNTSPGAYTARTSILYPGQVAPATSQFGFTVERKIVGIFISQLLLYAGITLGVGILFGLVGRFLIHRIRRSRVKPYDYSDVSKEDRLYYELVSDTIMQMRLRVGDDALLMAKTITELEIDSEGKVLNITKNPAKIMALLVLLYEKNFGKRVTIFQRKHDGRPITSRDTQDLDTVNKNIDVVRKYFQ